MNHFHFNINKHSVAFTWLMSYILVFLIPVISSIAIYFSTSKVIESEINNANKALLKQVQQIIDGHMQEIDKMSFKIEYDEKLQSILDKDGTFDAYNKLKIKKIISDFAIYRQSNEFIDKFFIYLNNQDAFITSDTYYSSAVLNDVWFNSTTNYVDLLKIIQSNQNSDAFIWTKNSNGSMEDILVYCKPVISASNYKSNAILVFMINKSKFLNGLKSIGWSSKGTVVILNEQNSILASTENLDITSAMKYSDLEQSYSINHYAIDGQNYSVSYIKSDILNWKYVSAIPTKVFTEKLDFIRKLTYFCIAVCLIAGAVISFLFTKKNYKPVNRLISIISKDSGTFLPNKHNEFSYIEYAINTTVKDKEKADQLLQRQNDVVCSNYILKLLKGQFNDDERFHNDLDSNGVSFLSDRCAVLLYYIEENLGPLKLKEDQSLLRFALKNIMEELAGRKHKGFMVEDGNFMACLVCMSKNTDENADLTQIAEETSMYLDKELQIQMSVSVSQVYNGLYGIAEAYEEANEIMDYKMLIGGGKILYHKDIQNRCLNRESYYYPIETEQQLINYIKTGDFENSQRLLNHIYENNFTNGKLSVSFAKCLIFDLLSTIVKTLDEMHLLGNNLLDDKLNPVDQIIKCDTIMDMKKRMSEILKTSCTYIKQDQKRPGTRIVNDIVEYVYKHYQDTNLSVSKVADDFQMNLSYISKLFKKQNGEGLYIFINKTRVEKAKSLLKNNNCSIGSIAKQVGFFNESTLIRVFKKFEGITPGKYKEICVPEE